MTTIDPEKIEIHHKALFEALQIGDLELPNRILMAPLTRSRSEKAGHTQSPLQALYYAQRASSGLIISEASQISQEGHGYAWTPGIFTEAQLKSWQGVTDAVHNAGGHIFCQLWHVGAVSHPVFQAEGRQPVSASAWTPAGKAFVGDYHPDGPRVDFKQARALRRDEIPRLLKDYQDAARCAKQAGFDGVELHAANGYLIDQFLRDSVNQRDDDYGGSIENRVHLLTEVVDSLIAVLPAERIGVRLSPIGGPGGSKDSAPEKLYPAAAKALSGKGLAYLHVARPNDHTSDGSGRARGEAILADMKAAFDGVFIANGNFDAAEAAEWIREGKADAIAFGRLFLANPDLPQRIREDGPYNAHDPETYYGGGAEGYVDYPSLNKTQDSL